ncbi:hypothetical protein M406DRAFT_290817 [Cryphonectria parasitica EP155]|uniref:Zn(2)-C6 fungal-type domain-containing protein n=1 Tax=Cryphonectria parasitica (strain ATCC 38755 / EP155) TaxID=660469 RepID=A0A9P4Y579_CRYP1|nr:uncharacterized protein M406DRAFT_290817 [Cryphonectria parasitica EP155]KAF3766365.1 hypothetical protein M406DRAFT_290817 [Cryphonectria parasitica EP155]
MSSHSTEDRQSATAPPEEAEGGEQPEDRRTSSVEPAADPLLSRSCYPCNQRKIRCDRRSQCSACRRSGRTCLYPPPGPRIRRTKRTIVADMSSRISNLERSLKRARQVDADAEAEVRTSRKNQNPGQSRQDILIQKGSSSQYFNEVLLSRVIKEEHCIDSVLTPPESTPGPVVPSPFNPLGIISSPDPTISPASLHPPSHMAVRLWSIYVDNVETCAGLRLLHLPTDEVKVYSVINDPASASYEHLALTFAIYYASTISLEPADAELVLKEDKETMLLRFKLGLEQAFAHGNFLDRPTISGLHALTIYVAALRMHNRGKGIWILNGLSIRIAQSLGLHRDGKRLGLSPFQAEIRRRLWWHLLSRDSRGGEDYGLENTNGPLLMSDVDLPANVHDTDLTPDMVSPPKPREGWTTMTFSLIAIELFKTMQTLAAMAATSPPTSPPSEAVRAKTIQELRARLDEWMAWCNPVIPQQRLTLFCARFLLKKTDFVTRLQWILLQQRAGLHSDFATEENLDVALEILERKMYKDDGLLKQFAWTRRAYPQTNVMLYVLLHLCVKPEGPLIDRAWGAIEAFFAEDVPREPATGLGPKLLVLVVLRKKAVAVREKLHSRRPGLGRDGAPEPGLALGEHSSSTSVAGVGGPAVGLEHTVADEYGLDNSLVDWPDWAALVQDFQLDTTDVFL